jgi:hypothetical protein
MSKPSPPPKTDEEPIEIVINFIQILSDAISKDPTAGNETLGVPCVVWLYRW